MSSNRVQGGHKEFRKSISFRLTDGMLVEEEEGGDIDKSKEVINEEEKETSSKTNEDTSQWENSSPELECTVTTNDTPGKLSTSTSSLYGNPLGSLKIQELMRSEDGQDEGGLIWNALIVPSDFDVQFDKKGKLKMLSKRHYDSKNGCIKPRRGMLACRENDFFSSLTRIDRSDDLDANQCGCTGTKGSNNINGNKDRWVFTGVLNGWPSLTCLELLKIELKGPFPTWREHWNSSDGVEPTYPQGTEVRAKLRAPSWSAFGWRKQSLGYIYWYESPASRSIPRVTYGTDIPKLFEKERIQNGDPSPRCVRVHMISHRYSVGDKGGVKDRLSYHSFAFLEWDHGKYGTVAEIGFLNGLGGYNCKSNWVENKDDGVMMKYMLPEMIAPWRESLSEVRCIDVKAKSLDEMLSYMKRHTGKYKRFLDVQNTFSHAVRLSFNSREHISQYLINYIRRGRTYSEIKSNCQTFSADFCAFLAGKKDVKPFHLLNRIEYRNHAHYFLYEGSMYPVAFKP